MLAYNKKAPIITRYINNNALNRIKKVTLFVLLMVISSTVIFSQTTYYSQGTGNFATLANWNTNPGGGGSSPAALTDLQSGLNNFIIQDAQIITLNDSININNLTIGGGTSGTLTIGNDATARQLVLQGTTTINVGGMLNVGAFTATHTIYIRGAVTNNGTIDLQNNSSQVANTILDGTFSISGNSSQFNNVVFNSGTITAGVSFDIKGNVTIETGTTFADGGFTHTVAGDWTENGTGQMTGTGTIQMNATLVQSIKTAATFNNLTFNGGSIATISGANNQNILTVNGNLYITNNTEVSTSSRHIVVGNFTVDEGSKYAANDGRITFNSTNAQTITVSSTSNFDEVYFDNGGAANPKTIVGNYKANDLTRVYPDAVIDGTGDQTIQELRLDGVCNFSGSIIFTGGRIYENAGDSSFTLGTADISIYGSSNIQTGDTMNIYGNFTSYSTFIIYNNAHLIEKGISKTFTLKDGKRMDIRGTNNFPSGFTNYIFEYNSIVYYNADMPQTVRGNLNYSRLYLQYNTKTVDGPLDVDYILYLRSSSVLDLSTYNHTFAGRIDNDSNGSITSTGTVTLDATDADQIVETAGTGVYTFNNLVITSTATSVVRTKHFYDNIIVNGNFTITNSGGSAANYIILDIDDHSITNDGGDVFTMGSNVELRTSGATSFETSMGSFATISIDASDVVRFDGTDQNIPGGFAYPNLEFQGNGNKTATGIIDVNGNVTRNANTPVFVDGGFSHTVSGNWNMGTAYTSMTGTVTFDGAAQNISASNFANVIFSGTGTKTLDGNIDVSGDLTINNGITLNAATRNINIEGNWSNVNGVCTQTTGTTTFDGAQNSKTITSNSSSYFGNLVINKTGGDKTITASSDIDADLDFDLTANNAVFNLNGYTIYIGRDFDYNTGTTFTHNNGTVIFDGASTDQLIRLYNASNQFYNVEFKNAGVKRVYDNDMDINGNVTIYNGATLRTSDNNRSITVQGNWTNSGSFQSNRSVTFDGANQTIGSSDFHDLYIDGIAKNLSETKTLGGNITLSGELHIQDGVTLDVSANNYNILVEERWYNDDGTNSGVFNPRQGTVTFNGAAQGNLYTGGSGSGKQFYNLTVNLTASQVILYTYDLRVQNDLYVQNGEFDPNNLDVFVGGSLINEGTFTYRASSLITMEATSGAHQIKGGSASFGDMTIDAPGATFTLESDLTFNTTRYRTLILNNGYFDLNSYDIDLLARDGHIDINGGTFEVDSAAIVTLGRDGYYTNDGGVFMIVGNAGADATLTSNQTTTTDYFTFIQNSGTFHAKYYHIEKIQGNGIEIAGGTIDATNNFSEGNFNNGYGPAGCYIKISGIDLGAGITASNVSFNSGPANNVIRLSGNGAITFENSSGNFTGAIYESDGGNLINWTFPGGYFWDDGGGDNDWNNALNWAGNTRPNSSANVFLEHTNGGLASTYTVNINAADAVCGRLTIDPESGNSISLILNGYELQVNENVDIKASATLTQTNATDTLFVAGSWSNAGTFNENSAVVVFNGTSGTSSISTGGASDSFYNLEINADGATYTLSSAMDITNNLNLKAGTLSASANNITIDGNWYNTGGTFDPGTAKVTFQGAGAQSIDGGNFYNFYTGGSGTKTLTGNIDVGRDVRIQAGTVLDGASKIIYVTRNWRNDVGNAGFTQTGIGSVFFDGANQNIGNSGIENTFNNVYFQGTGTKTVSQNITVNGDMYIKSGINRVTLQSAVTVTGSGASNTLNQTGGELRIEGINNFPTGFENINLSAGNVRYYSNSDQTVYSTTYYGLILQRQNSGKPNKTLSGDISATTITLNDNQATMDVAGYTITLSGNFSFGSGNAITWNNGALVHEGAGWNIDADFTEFHNLTLKGSGTKRMYGNLTITGDVAIQASGVTLRMDTYTMNCTGLTKSFTMNAGTFLTCGILDPTVAFPSGFSSYSLDPTSRVTLNGAGNQIINCSFTYGELYLRSTGNATMNAALDVDGNFDMNNNPTLVDGGFDLNLAGSTIDIRSYMPGANTITFDGTNQSIQNETGANPDNMYFNNIVFAGSGTKSMNNNNDQYNISGNVTINNGVTVDSDEDWVFSGSTFTNNGIFDNTGGNFTMNGSAGQNIDPGANNTFNNISFSNGGGNKTVINNGMDINGTFTINLGATLDMGAVTHTISSATITNSGSWITTNANLTFDRNGGQTIPALTAKDIICTTSGTKTLSGNWSIDNLSIETPARLDVGDGLDYSITLTGNWSNTGTFYDRNGTVSFESSDGTTKTIDNNGNNFWQVLFNQAQTNSRTYTINDDFRIADSLAIGNGATVDLNGHILILGDNDTPDQIETHTIDSGGELQVDEGATLEFNSVDGSSVLNVAGTFSVVGVSGNIATVTNETSNTGRRIDINITTGTIAARYYHFRYMVDSGMDVQATASIDATNNFSDGSWSDISTSGSGTHRYLILDATAPVASINNVTFNHGGTPSVGVHYNVQRVSTADVVTFGGTINGELAGETYEDDAGNKITWPVITTKTWNGSTSTDWHTAANWTPAGVPNSSSDVVIPSASNNPIINTSNASVKSLQISTGTLTIDAGYDLNVADDIVIGTSTNAGILAIGNSGSTITVGGSWTRGTNGVFINGSSTITFNAGSGNVNIDPDDDSFYNIIFNGGATFNLYASAPGAIFDVDGSFTISSGTVTPSTNNYVLTIGGNLTNSGGNFSTSTNGTVKLDGTGAQSITTMTFDNLTVDGSGTKTFNGTNVIQDALQVNSTLAVATGGSLDMNDDVTIDATGTFDDGGESHTFAGAIWTGSGTYTGSGTITFDGGNVDIYASSFNNIVFNGTGSVELFGNVDVTGDITIYNTINQFYCYTYLINNTSGTGTFTLENGEYIRVRGANNFPSNFTTYTLGETSYTYYDGTIDQSIAGITYGRLYLQNNTTKTLNGNIDVNERLYINDATLDVSTSNYKINIASHWYNNSTGTFVQRSGEIIFDGTADQNINLGTTGTNDFYKLTVNKSSGTVNVQNASLTIEDNLRVLSGTFSANGQTVNVGGNITVTNGTIAQSGTINLNKASGSATIQANSSSFNNLTINSGATYTLQDNLSVANNFTLTSGTFDGNGNTVNLGGNLDVVSISGIYKIGAGGYLKLGQNVSLTVNSGGIIYVVGSASNYAYVTNRSGTTRYNFTVNGIIHALYYKFDYMNSSGIYVTSNGTINSTNNFSYGTFANPISAGTCLKVENTQSFTNASKINNVNFPDNPGGGATNIKKASAVSGTLEFYNATGSFSGSTFENDPNGLINWTGPVTLTWTGVTSSDWNTASNWSASSGPDKVPTGSEDVIIASALNQPEITITSDTCKSLLINTSAFVSINSADVTTDLVVLGNLEIQGTLSMNSSNDKIEVGGDWYLNGGLFTNGQGTVEMNSTTGSQSLNSGTTPFYDLIINSIGTVDISSTLNISNDLTITTGTLNVTATDYTVNVSGNFINLGTFNSQNGKVVLKSTAAATKIFNPGSSSFYNLSIEGGASTIYQLTTNNLTVNEGLTVLSGTFDLNSLTLNLGDGTGTDDINIEGVMIVDENAFLKLKSGASVFVNSGGVFKAIGTNDLNVATITNQGSGTYSFSINSGGTIHANYYLIEYINATGIWVKTGASIDEATNNFSNGTWSNGTSTGRYLLLENNFTGNFTASNLYFNAGPAVNIKRISGSGNITINDGFGAIAGEIYEEDDGSATTGRVRWSYTNPLYTWNGGTTDWNTALNWDISGGGNGVPNNTSNVVIPNTGTDPMLNNVNGSALTLNINNGATLTIDGNYNLVVDGSLTNNGTLTIANGSSSTITVLDTWSNSGTFNSGNASTIELTANTGTKNITTGGSTFYNLLVNSGGAGTATFTTLSSLDINGDLTLQSGTLEVTDPGHTITVAGNWTNTGGGFTNGSSSVTFDGAAQTISKTGAETFYDVTFAGTGTKTLTSNIIVTNDLTISSTLLISNGQAIEVKGSWNNTGTLSHAGTSTVSFTGTTTQSITNTGGATYNNLTINNTSSTFPQILLSDAITVTGTLTLTDGIVQTSIIDLLTLSSTGSLSGGTTSASYIDGPMGRNGTSNFTFPIGAGTVFARLGVSGMSASANLVAQYFDVSYTDTTNFGTGVRNVSEIEYWDLTRTSGTGNPYVSIYWEDGNRSVITDPSTLIVTHYSGGQWVNMGGSVSGTQTNGYVASTSQFTSFSPITLGDGTGGSNPLPIELAEFDAQLINNTVKINWSTLSEENNDYFTVERSKDGFLFESIGQIEGAGNSNEIIIYELIDDRPYTGTSYYRLKQTDFNGEFSYSKIVTVNNQEKENITETFNLKIYPNPASEFVKVAGENFEKFSEIEIIISNNNGAAVRNYWFITDASGGFNKQLELNDFKSGIYFVTIVAGNVIKNKQIIIR